MAPVLCAFGRLGCFTAGRLSIVLHDLLRCRGLCSLNARADIEVGSLRGGLWLRRRDTSCARSGYRGRGERSYGGRRYIHRKCHGRRIPWRSRVGRRRSWRDVGVCWPARPMAHLQLQIRAHVCGRIGCFRAHRTSRSGGPCSSNPIGVRLRGPREVDTIPFWIQNLGNLRRVVENKARRLADLRGRLKGCLHRHRSDFRVRYC